MKRVPIALAILFTAVLAQAQPYLVKDINETTEPRGSHPADFLTLGNLSIFTTNDQDGNPLEVWRSDGSAAGTFRLGKGGRDVAVWNGKVWFIGADSGMYSSDGTQAGQAVPLPAGLVPFALMPSGPFLYFAGNNELWRTDGTAAGTTQMQTPGPIYINPPDASPQVGQSVLFLTYNYVLGNIDSRTLWRADTQLQQVMTFPANRVPMRLIGAGSLAYLEVSYYANNGSANELWRTDGTAAGTFMLKTGLNYWKSTSLGAAPPAAHFTVTASGVWRTDGTLAGTVALPVTLPPETYYRVVALGTLPNGKVILSGPPGPPVDVNASSEDGIYAFDGTNTTFLFNLPRQNGAAGKVLGNVFILGGKEQLWRTDGTVGGSYKLADLTGDEGGQVWDMQAAGSLMYVSALDPVHGWELFKTDGTIPGTGLVEDIIDVTYPSFPRTLRALNGGVVFSAISGGEIQHDAYPRDLWFSDGTLAGTQKLLSETTVDTYGMLACGGRAYFMHETAAAGNELWSTNGTPLGTAMIKDLDPRQHDGGPYSSYPQGFTCVDDRVLFYARGAEGLGLWRSDGTAAGTLQVSLFPAGSETGHPPTRFGQGIFFPLRVNSNGQLWLSDGTPAGTKTVKEVGDFYTPIVTAGYSAYFIAGASRNLWRTNGTAAGTTTMAIDGSAYGLFPFGDRVAFGKDSSVRSLCSTDGGTVSCFEPSALLYENFSMWPMNGRLYYNMRDLRSTDGVTATSTGAALVSKIMAVAGGRLYFLRSSSELLETDATYAGTRVLFEAPVYEAAPAGGRLFIGSDELYAYDLPVTPTSLAPRTVPSGSGGQVVINGRGFIGPVSVYLENTPVSVVSVTPTAITFTAPPRQPGTYEVKFITGDGREMTTDDRLAYSCTGVTATVNANPPAVCPLTPVQLHGGGGTRCAWFPATGLDNPASCHPVATVATTTTYTLIASDATGCASTNHPTVTVTINPKPSAQIGLTPPAGGSLVPGATYEFFVPDAGAGATYAWTVTNAQLNAAANQRTVSITTGCERPKLAVTVTTAAGCSASSSIEPLLSSNLRITIVNPSPANAGTVINVIGTGFTCVTSVTLHGSFGSYDLAVPYTIATPEWLSFRLPANAPASSRIGLQSPFGVAFGTLSQTLYRPLRDDLTGSGMTTDILARNATTGLTQVWGVNRDGTITGPTIKRDAGTQDLTVAAVHEFGWTLPAADILWQRTSTREFVLQLNGRVTEPVLSRVPAADLELATVGDVDGNGFPDLIMRSTNTGATEIWTISSGFGPVSMQPLHGGGNLGWKIIGSRDFDGDGTHDLLWRDTNNGMTLIWFMKQGTIRASQIVHQGGNTAWTIAALGDFDADGKSDLLWRHVPTGATLLWKMNGAAIVSSTSIHPGGNTGWHIVASGDFNGDSKADVLWRDSSQAGTVLRWEMNGAQITKSSILLPTLDPAMVIESPRM